MTTPRQNGVADQPTPLRGLSSSISHNVNVISEYLENNHVPLPTFESDGPSTPVPSDAPLEIQKARQSLIAAALEISHLAIGPGEFLPHLATGFQYISCLSWLCTYSIFHHVPLTKPISYPALAKAAGVPESRLKSIIRMAMTTGLFLESPPASSPDQHPTVRHSATSAHLARDADALAYAAYMCARSAPIALHMTDAHRRWGPSTTRPYETAYNVAFGTDLPFFEHIGRDAERMAGFARYMQCVRSSDSVGLGHLAAGFDWRGVREGGVVVDVGGSTGDAAISLARAFPHLTFIVQDLPANAEKGAAKARSLPDDLASRLSFQAHDFTKPQPALEADIYLLRMILHDWADADAVRTINNIVAAFDKAGKSRLLIMDTVLPEPGSVPVSEERIARARDLTMMQAFNSNERDLEGWKGLLDASDHGLRLANVIQPFGSALSILEACEGATAFESDLAAKRLRLLEKTFEISYPLPKLDLGAVPDFLGGAIENWGLVLCRKNALLFAIEPRRQLN